MEMCSRRNTRVLGLPTPPDRVNPSGGTSRLFCEVFRAEHIDGFGWISRRLGGAGWVVGLSSHRSLCEGHLISEMGWGEREVFLQEHFVVLRGSIDPAVYAKWRSVPEGTLWKTHIHGPGLVRINRSIVGS